LRTSRAALGWSADRPAQEISVAVSGRNSGNDAMAILRLEGGQWKVFEYDIGISDPILQDWREKRRRFVG
jgi:hypothetical protein